jgi:hypothetical protein
MKHLYFFLLLSLSLNAQVSTTVTDSIVVNLDEVSLAARRENKQITLGNASRRHAVIQPHSSDWDMLGKLFPYTEAYATTPYI